MPFAVRFPRSPSRSRVFLVAFLLLAACRRDREQAFRAPPIADPIGVLVSRDAGPDGSK